jgi:hypothetical protein
MDTENNIHFIAAFLCYANVYEYGSVLIMLIVVTETNYPIYGLHLRSDLLLINQR